MNHKLPRILIIKFISNVKYKYIKRDQTMTKQYNFKSAFLIFNFFYLSSAVMSSVGKSDRSRPLHIYRGE